MPPLKSYPTPLPLLVLVPLAIALTLASAEPWLDSASLFWHPLGRAAVLPSDLPEVRGKYATLSQQATASPGFAQPARQAHMGSAAVVHTMATPFQHFCGSRAFGGC